MKELKSMTEEELREFKVPWPKTLKELDDIILALTERAHDYGTCVYAMSIAATATFYYVSHVLGVTGFQASCADMDIISRTRNMRGPFMIIDGTDMLYPQSDPKKKLADAMEEWKEWAAEEARKKLAETPLAADPVYDHWRKLANETTGTT